jgi:tetraacyldisaccharide 4'-kinase
LERAVRLSGIALTPLSVAYAGLLAARAAWWRRYAQTAPLPTVSVGNLTVGGNGKTPFTLFLAARLRQLGVMAAIVGRGYRGQLSRSPGLVSDGKYIRMTPRQAGDEPVMMAKCFAGPIGVARRRIDAIKLLATNRLADMVVLDDGFQHVRLRRDCDLLVMNDSIGLGNGRLLPAGPLRESPRALERADALIVIQSLGAERSIECPVLGLAPTKPILRARLEPSSLTYSDNGKWCEMPLVIKGRRVMAVSGIANPAGFHAMINALGAKLLSTLVYPDHYDYGPGDWSAIMAAGSRTDMVITTEKDLVKLEHLGTPAVPLYALHLKVAMETKNESQLLTLVMERITHFRGAGAHCEVQGGPISGVESRLA